MSLQEEFDDEDDGPVTLATYLLDDFGVDLGLHDLESVINSSTSSYVTKIKSLIEVWGQVGHSRFEDNEEYIVRLMDWLKRHTLNIVLHGDWKSQKHITNEYEEKLLNEINNFAQYLVNINSMYSVCCQKLAEIVKDPWGNTSLVSILSGADKGNSSEVLEFFRMETGYILSTRLKHLCKHHCEDLALNLLRVFIKYHRRSEEENFSLNASLSQIRYCYDVYIALLFRSRIYSEIVSVLGSMSLDEGLELMTRFTKKRVSTLRIWKHSRQIVHIIATEYVGEILAKPPENSVRILEAFLEVWLSVTNINSEPLVEIFKENIRRIILGAESAILLYPFCEMIYKKFSKELKTFVIELYIRALTTDMNIMEREKNENEAEKMTATAKRLSNGFLQLADVLDEHVKVSRECTLTSFSLLPTRTSFTKLITLAARSGCEPIDFWKCKYHPPNMSGSDLTRCNHCGEYISEVKKVPLNINTALSEALTAEEIGLGPQLCDDLVVLLSCPRYQFLNWLVPWTDLYRLCVIYLDDAEGTRNFVTDLKYVEIDYSVLPPLSRDLDINKSKIDVNIEKWEASMTKKPPKFADMEKTTSSLQPNYSASSPNVLKSLRQYRKLPKQSSTVHTVLDSEPFEKVCVPSPSVPSTSSTCLETYSNPLDTKTDFFVPFYYFVNNYNKRTKLIPHKKKERPTSYTSNFNMVPFHNPSGTMIRKSFINESNSALSDSSMLCTPIDYSKTSKVLSKSEQVENNSKLSNKTLNSRTSFAMEFEKSVNSGEFLNSDNKGIIEELKSKQIAILKSDKPTTKNIRSFIGNIAQENSDSGLEGECEIEAKSQDASMNSEHKCCTGDICDSNSIINENGSCNDLEKVEANTLSSKKLSQSKRKFYRQENKKLKRKSISKSNFCLEGKNTDSPEKIFSKRRKTKKVLLNSKNSNAELKLISPISIMTSKLKAVLEAKFPSLSKNDLQRLHQIKANSKLGEQITENLNNLIQILKYLCYSCKNKLQSLEKSTDDCNYKWLFEICIDCINNEHFQNNEPVSTCGNLSISNDLKVINQETLDITDYEDIESVCEESLDVSKMKNMSKITKILNLPLCNSEGAYVLDPSFAPLNTEISHCEIANDEKNSVKSCCLMEDIQDLNQRSIIHIDRGDIIAQNSDQLLNMWESTVSITNPSYILNNTSTALVKNDNYFQNIIGINLTKPIEMIISEEEKKSKTTKNLLTSDNYVDCSYTSVKNFNLNCMFRNVFEKTYKNLINASVWKDFLKTNGLSKESVCNETSTVGNLLNHHNECVEKDEILETIDYFKKIIACAKSICITPLELDCKKSNVNISLQKQMHVNTSTCNISTIQRNNKGIIDVKKKYNLRNVSVVLKRLGEKYGYYTPSLNKKHLTSIKTGKHHYKVQLRDATTKLLALLKTETYSRTSHLQDLNPKVISKSRKCILPSGIKLHSDASEPYVLISRLQSNDKYKPLFQNIPGLNDLQHIKPNYVNSIVQVIQVPESRTNTTISGNMMQISPHIQRIGQPRLEKMDCSNLTSTSTTVTTSVCTPSTLNILSQQTVQSTNNLKSSKAHSAINILSQTIKPPPGCTSGIQVNNIPRVITSGEQILNQLIHNDGTTQTLKTLVSSTGPDQNRIVQLICKASDGKFIPVTSFTSNKVVKLSMTQTVNSQVTGNTIGTEENVTKISQTTTKIKAEVMENSEILPKFQQAFGKPAYQNCANLTDNLTVNNTHEQTSLDKYNTKYTLEKDNTTINVQPLQGVLYAHVPVGQTINIIPPACGKILRIATSSTEELSLVKETVIQGKMTALLAAALQGNKQKSNEICINAESFSQTSTQLALAATPSVVQNACIVKPIIQIPSNAIRNAPQCNLSSTTLEQLREFDMVYNQVKERSDTGTTSDSNAQTDSNEETRHVSVTYLNQGQNINCSPLVVVSNYCGAQSSSPSLNISSHNSASSYITTAPTPIVSKIPVKVKSRIIKTPISQIIKTTPLLKPAQKSQEDEHTTQRIFDILAEYAEQLRNSPDLHNKPAPRRRSNPCTNPTQNAKRKKNSGAKKIEPNSLIDLDVEDSHTIGSEDSSCGVTQLSTPEDEQSMEMNENSLLANQIILTDTVTSQHHNLIITDSSVNEALKVSGTAVLVPGSYIMPVSMIKGNQQIVLSGRNKILATVPTRNTSNMLLFQSFLNEPNKPLISTVKCSAVQPIIDNSQILSTSKQTSIGVSSAQNMSLRLTQSDDTNVSLKTNSDREVFLTIPDPLENKNISSERVRKVYHNNFHNKKIDKKKTTYIATFGKSKVDSLSLFRDVVSSSEASSIHTTSSQVTSTTSVSTFPTKSVITHFKYDFSGLKEVDQKSKLLQRLEGSKDYVQDTDDQMEGCTKTVLMATGTANGFSLPCPTSSVCSNLANSTVSVTHLTKHIGDNGKLNISAAEPSIHKKSGRDFKMSKKFSKQPNVTNMQHKKVIVYKDLQKSLSEECADLGVDEPRANELFPEADFINSSSNQLRESTDEHKEVGIFYDIQSVRPNYFVDKLVKFSFQGIANRTQENSSIDSTLLNISVPAAQVTFPDPCEGNISSPCKYEQCVYRNYSEEEFKTQVTIDFNNKVLQDVEVVNIDSDKQ